MIRGRLTDTAWGLVLRLGTFVLGFVSALTIVVWLFVHG